jgi:hypothetical protein
MNFIKNHRYYKAKIVPVGDQGDSDCLTVYSKRAAEFDEADFDRDLRAFYQDVSKQDEFGIVLLRHNAFEFLVEHTNKGFSIRAFNLGRPDYSLDKMAFNLTLGDLLK